MSIISNLYYKAFQDLVAKALGYVGAAVAGAGLATGEQWQMIAGAASAFAGIVWNVWLNWSKPVPIVVHTNVAQKRTGGSV